MENTAIGKHGVVLRVGDSVRQEGWDARERFIIIGIACIHAGGSRLSVRHAPSGDTWGYTNPEDFILVSSACAQAPVAPPPSKPADGDDNGSVTDVEGIRVRVGDFVTSKGWGSGNFYEVMSIRAGSYYVRVAENGPLASQRLDYGIQAFRPEVRNETYTNPLGEVFKVGDKVSFVEGGETFTLIRIRKGNRVWAQNARWNTEPGNGPDGSWGAPQNMRKVPERLRITRTVVFEGTKADVEKLEALGNERAMFDIRFLPFRNNATALNNGVLRRVISYTKEAI